MAVPVILPKMEMSQETAEIVEWHKRDGDQVKKGEVLLSVETDKVVVEIESPGSGILSGIKTKPGDVVPVSTAIAYLLAPGELGPAGTIQTVPASQLDPQPTVPLVTPVAMRMAEANHLNILGLVGTGLKGRVTKSDVAAVLAPTPTADALMYRNDPTQPEKVRATPAARRLARNHSLPLQSVGGSGPRGRIQAVDVDAFVANQKSASAALVESDVETIPFEGIRRTIAERLQRSYQTAPHINFSSRVDVTGLEDLRQSLNNFAEESNATKISLTALLVKVLAWTLCRHPWLNSSLQNETITLYHHAHIGVAVALKEGLIVPVVRDADRKGISQIAKEVKDLTERARHGKLAPADVSGGTFTLSNLGPYGIEQFTAILNPGQTGILAVGAIHPEPVVLHDVVAVRPIMNMTLSVDHRVVDGAVAAQFMADLCRAIRNTGLLLW